MNYAGYAVAVLDLLCNHGAHGTLHFVPADLKPTKICKIKYKNKYKLYLLFFFF